MRVSGRSAGVDSNAVRVYKVSKDVYVCMYIYIGGAERAVPKDLLTGAALGERERQVSQANDAFYDAYEKADLQGMRRLWGKTAHVKCCHPGIFWGGRGFEGVRV